MKQLPDNCIDITVTSPPYNFGRDYESMDDEQIWNDYYDFLFEILKENTRITKHTGRIIINIQPSYNKYEPSHIRLVDFMTREMGLLWRSEFVWHKQNCNCKTSAFGSWRSPSSPNIKSTWEYIYVFAKGSEKKPGKTKDSDLTRDQFLKWTIGMWDVAPENRQKKLGHPAMMPEEITKRCIKLFSWPGDIVFDPFNGLGTTTLVARQNNRRYLGIDISQEYCNNAIVRMEEEEK